MAAEASSRNLGLDIKLETEHDLRKLSFLSVSWAVSLGKIPAVIDAVLPSDGGAKMARFRAHRVGNQRGLIRMEYFIFLADSIFAVGG